jgi:carbon monoxide dehydrogenase subunit G
MLIKNERLLPCGQAQAWAALNDEAVLQACIPGCESLQRLAPEQLEAVVAAALGPVRARFKAKLGLQDIRPPQGYSLVFEGQAGAAGFSKGTARIELLSEGESQTLLRYEAQVQIGGKLAQIGSRVIEAAAQKIIGEFFVRLEAQLAAAQAPTEAAAQPAAASAGWLARLLGWLRALLGRGQGSARA